MSEPVMSEAQYHAQQIEIACLSRTVQDQQAEIERLWEKFEEYESVIKQQEAVITDRTESAQWFYGAMTGKLKWPDFSADPRHPRERWPWLEGVHDE